MIEQTKGRGALWRFSGAPHDIPMLRLPDDPISKCVWVNLYLYTILIPCFSNVKGR